jgi:hypothetical protein
MSDSDLQEEKESILERLFDAFFGRSNATEGEKRSDVFRLGSVNRRLEHRD